ncbi:DUF3152 domain-containing protein [Hamadaea sp. NPDC050747]|uniref:DUF3152 domain-containing protein n=1 Tax=Hamadaea sp. NPDC050747 TaxID=3155789 RepID=UPI0033E52904
MRLRTTVTALILAVIAAAAAILLTRPAAAPAPVSAPSSAHPTPPLAPIRHSTEPHRPAPIPASGSGTFTIDASAGPLLGDAGRLRRFHVAVETTVADGLGDFSRTIDETLGDRRSWIGDHEHRFQRVPGAAPADFTIYLATRETAYRLCRAGGVNIRVGGVPYTSCRRSGAVVINYDRWRLAVPDYTSAGTPLAVYRAYVINHEVGHELGHGHLPCPGAGRPAPVMQTQTLGLRGCLANPWPHPTTR